MERVIFNTYGKWQNLCPGEGTGIFRGVVFFTLGQGVGFFHSWTGGHIFPLRQGGNIFSSWNLLTFFSYCGSGFGSGRGHRKYLCPLPDQSDQTWTKSSPLPRVSEAKDETNLAPVRESHITWIPVARYQWWLSDQWRHESLWRRDRSRHPEEIKGVQSAK